MVATGESARSTPQARSAVISHPEIDMRVRDCSTQEGLEADAQLRLPMDLSLYGLRDECDPAMAQGPFRPMDWAVETAFESRGQSFTASHETLDMALAHDKGAMSTIYEISSEPSPWRREVSGTGPTTTAMATTQRAPPGCNSEANRGDGRRDANDEYRRRQRLQRNRAAASRYREKRRSWMRQLEASRAELVDQRAGLEKEYQAVLEEATRVKTRLMVHAVCHDPRIDMWIESEAACFAGRSLLRHAARRHSSQGHRGS